ncbi:MAG: FAD-binding oxidoreductase [Candidatus Eremiobacteraeota bacterium]|nr:FAD-binding oxidoreductase [Candidatus Eremiobacteraeota bacterium]
MRATRERATPKSTQGVAKIVARCDRGGNKIRIAGGETLNGMGHAPERVDVTLSTVGLTGIAANERTDLVISVRAGTPIANLTSLLASQGQFVPFDAPQPQYATLGGTLAAGWLGPRRHLYGRPRDFLIGTTIVLADGTIARAGGMVVKNVAGYDMSRLYVGSFGTLGVLTQANLKTIPRPTHARLFLAPLPERTRERACTQLSALRVPPSAAFVIEGFHHAIDGDEGPEGRLLLLLEGSAALIERATLELRSALGRAGVPETRIVDAGAREAFERVVDAYVASLGERSVTYRLYPLAREAPSSASQMHGLAQSFELRGETIADLMNGDVVLRVSDLDSHAFGSKIENFDEALHAMMPAAQVVASNHPHRANLRVWGTPPAAIDRMRALKARFDPNRTLNPGCFVGGM